MHDCIKQNMELNYNKENKMKEFLKKSIVGVLIALCVNAVFGAVISTAVFGVSPIIGAVTANVIAFACYKFMPKGALCAGVLAEIWTGEMIKKFRESPENYGWYDKIKSYDQYVNNDVIHFTEIGGDPNVLVNNSTYPLNIKSLEDADKPVSLDKFDTEATPVTDDELHACSYDKMGSVQERHREALKAKTREKGLHAIAPDGDTEETPVMLTTGDTSTDGTRKKFTPKDIIAIKRKFDSWKVPAADRVLVLCSDHVNDLLEVDQKFAEHYNINQTEGKIARLYGFDIYEYTAAPYYTVSTKKELAWGAIPTVKEQQASIAYYNGHMMKANGSVQFYHQEASSDPLYHRNLVNFRLWHLCLPLQQKKNVVAVVSNVVA